MDFKKKAVAFSLKDVGSSVIDQISSDIYSGPGSIFRELVKNAYDSYLALPSDELDEDDFARNIVISRGRDSKGIGRITVADNGIGQDLDDLKANVQISITHKADLDNATGFRGLGSWATLGAGSKIVITSTKRGIGKRFRLTIDVRRTYGRMGPDTTLDDILNDPKCLWFEEDDAPADKASHQTVVEIVCDGKATKVNGYELNRLFPYTDPANDELRTLLAQHCPIPFSLEGGAYQEVRRIYAKTNYVPTPIVLDGDVLNRRLPQEVTNILSEQIHVGGKVAAYVWYADNPRSTGELNNRIDEQQHMLSGPGIQLCRLNVPIGPKSLFSDGLPRANTLDWYVGEVHVVLADVLPNASGQELRAGTARDTFIQELRTFYTKIGNAAEEKSDRLNLEKKLKKAIEATAQLAQPLSRAEKAQADVYIDKAVQALEAIKQGKTVADKRLRTAAQDPDVAKLAREARKSFKGAGLLKAFSPAKAAKAAKRSKSSKGSLNAQTGGERLISVDEFQACLGSTAPRLAEVGLTPQQIQQVFKIVSELVVAPR